MFVFGSIRQRELTDSKQDPFRRDFYRLFSFNKNYRILIYIIRKLHKFITIGCLSHCVSTTAIATSNIIMLLMY